MYKQIQYRSQLPAILAVWCRTTISENKKGEAGLLLLIILYDFLPDHQRLIFFSAVVAFKFQQVHT
jgi:hypothetical protein